VEKQTSIVYTYNVFKKFQAEVVAARDNCSVVGITQVENAKLVTINDGPEKKDRVVHWCTLNKFGVCSCKFLRGWKFHVTISS
jgi:hypothetical protein